MPSAFYFIVIKLVLGDSLQNAQKGEGAQSTYIHLISSGSVLITQARVQTKPTIP